MLSKISIIPVALVALGGSQLASASDYDQGQWVTSFMAGSGLIPNGSFNPQVMGDFAGVGTAQIDHLQFRDAFRAGPSFSIETGYLTESNVEPFARLSYSQMRGRTVDVGTVAAGLASPSPIDASFGDMDSWALNIGTRYFLTDNGPLRTYVAGYLGADRTDALHAHWQIPGLTPMSPREEFLPQETRFDAGVEGGVAWQVSDNADLSLSLGAQYMNPRRDHTDAFTPLGIDEVQFTDPRWSIPVNFGVNFRF
ncbi:MAG TPA: hypothetical protein VH814_12665 [Steroidobacteraceae bacterium]|jgi:hypothetical protein